MVTEERRLVPGGETRAEIEVHRSRFIASAAPAFTVSQAREFIARIRREFPDATHHVAAYVVGHGESTVAHCNDDGEPSGTAGRPALAVLQGSGLGDVVVVVTRYFGGTKLGTGGLVRAYGDAVRAVLRELPRAEKTIVYVLRFVAPYSLFERVRQLIEAEGGRILSSDFGAAVTVTAEVVAAALPTFQAALRSLSNGTLQAEIVEEKLRAIPLHPALSPRERGTGS